LLADLGIRCFADLQRRSEHVRVLLPPLWEVAEAIIAGNPHVGARRSGCRRSKRRAGTHPLELGDRRVELPAVMPQICVHTEGLAKKSCGFLTETLVMS
jgi:hypothetical protein